MNNYFYDQHNIRCNLIQTKAGKPINWLFVPGGAGIDSRYFKDLINLLDLPGNVWLIDLPGNGDHQINVAPNYNYDQWFEIFKDLVNSFENPIMVGHSFGAMLGLLISELEQKLKGFVVLNSSPKLWMEAAGKAAQMGNKPDISPAMNVFVKDPTQNTFEKALEACFPYYFPESSMDKGRALFAGLPFPFEAAVWCQTKMSGINYDAKWVPRKIPMLIISGTEDYICPPNLFKEDPRFQGSNITINVLKDAGHFPWLEKPREVTSAFASFIDKIVV